MHNWDYKSAKIGEFLPELKLEPISRINLAQYADASGDHNPLHIDTDYANVYLQAKNEFGLSEPSRTIPLITM